MIDLELFVFLTAEIPQTNIALHHCMYVFQLRNVKEDYC